MNNAFDTVMARLQYRHVRQPAGVTELDLDDFERELGHPLPTGYRNFLQKFGFAVGDGDVRFTASGSPDEVETSVDVFYGLQPGDTYDIRRRRSAFADRLPDHLLPFTSGSGGEFCLCLTGVNAGKVYWWFQEQGEVDSEDDMEPIADNFEEFINSLVTVAD